MLKEFALQSAVAPDTLSFHVADGQHTRSDAPSASAPIGDQLRLRMKILSSNLCLRTSPLLCFTRRNPTLRLLEGRRLLEKVLIKSSLRQHSLPPCMRPLVQPVQLIHNTPRKPHRDPKKFCCLRLFLRFYLPPLAPSLKVQA